MTDGEANPFLFTFYYRTTPSCLASLLRMRITILSLFAEDCGKNFLSKSFVSFFVIPKNYQLIKKNMDLGSQEQTRERRVGGSKNTTVQF